MADAAIDVQQGLTAAEVADRVARGQINDVPATPTRTVGQIVRSNVFTLFNAILGVMLVLILVVGPLQDALFGIVLVANAAIGIIQELRAKQTLDRLTVLTAPKAAVVRGGASSEVAVGEVVLDDVLEITAGSEIVVDGEVLENHGLEVDESMLTGESDPVDKAVGDQVLSGSFVVAGSGRYRATKVGREAYAVQLAQDARRFTLTHSELRAGINRILVYITFAMVPTAILLFISQFRVTSHWREAVSGAVAGTVAMIPEGLVLLTSLAFAVAVIRLARQRVLVQELAAVEGLARVDVLCIDKTGTLTEGKLTVLQVEAAGDRSVTQAKRALAAMAAADRSPNATMHAIGEHYDQPPDWQPADAVPFSSARKWSGAEFEDEGAWVLGAPDVLLQSIDHDDPDDHAIVARVSEETEAGHRIVLLCRAERLTGEDLPPDLDPVAFVALGDRPRATAADTLRYFREQDVTVKVISGDDPRTVGAIARELGLPGAEDPFDARELPEDEAALAAVMEERSVFGRVSPQQKRAMVQALRSRGHTVAMTGDGVNDALALKDADIGVAMGSGSDATRAVAELVLLDSDFAALPPVVAEGRRVLGNIERTSGLYLNKTVYAMLISLVTGIFAFTFPFLPRHLTLISSLTIGIPSFFLALAPNTQRFHPGFVDRVLRFAIPTGVLAATGTLLAYTLARHQVDLTLAQQRTSAVITLAFVGLLVLTILAAPLTPLRIALIWAMTGLFLLAMALPISREFFALEVPPLAVWLTALGIAAVVWFLARLFVPGGRPVGPQGPDRPQPAAAT
jgi:cation-transporting ATPase E